MWFLLKAGFWFSAVLLVLPLFGEEQSSPAGSSETVSPLAFYETVSAMTIAVDDVRAMCERHPAVCETGGEALQALGLQARDGARIALGYLDDTFGETAIETVPTVAEPALADLLPVDGAPENAIPAGADTLATGTVTTETSQAVKAGTPLSITVPVPVPAPTHLQ